MTQEILHEIATACKTVEAISISTNKQAAINKINRAIRTLIWVRERINK